MQLKVMTFNLLYHGAVNPAGAWSARFPLVLDVIRGGADVIAVQEATSVQVSDLKRELSDYTLVSGPESGETRMPRALQMVGRMLGGRRGRIPKEVPVASTLPIATQHPPHHTAHHHHHRRGEHCAILYRTDRFDCVEGNAFWLSHQPHVPGSVLPGSWLPRVVNWVRLQERGSDQCVMVFNAHLDYLPWSPARSARILRRMLDTHWNNSPQILMGDFNAAPNSAAYKHLGSELKQGLHSALTDAWMTAEERHGPEGTYHGGTGRVRWIGRLDRILFRPHLTVERITTITHHEGSIFPSDHYPVLAELHIPRSTGGECPTPPSEHASC
jgi:endonuclease/exonuclease/phosphatase family metal-dependent hydrolase